MLELSFKEDLRKSKHLKERYDELSLEYALSQHFSPKQEDLFRKKLEKAEPFDPAFPFYGKKHGE
jgi:hypothetical protein